jgi:hypothetical protein
MEMAAGAELGGSDERKRNHHISSDHSTQFNSIQFNSIQFKCSLFSDYLRPFLLSSPPAQAHRVTVEFTVTRGERRDEIWAFHFKWAFTSRLDCFLSFYLLTRSPTTLWAGLDPGPKALQFSIDSLI